MLGFDELRCFAVDLRDGINQVGGVQLVAACIALIAARAGRATDWAGAFNVAVRKGAPRRRANSAQGCLLHHVAVGVQRREKLLDDGVVVARRRPGKEVIGKTKSGQVFNDLLVVCIGKLLHTDAFFFRLNQERSSVLISAGDHEYVAPTHSLVTGKNVGGNTEAGDVSNVAGPIGIGPGDRRKYGCRHTV